VSTIRQTQTAHLFKGFTSKISTIRTDRVDERHVAANTPHSLDQELCATGEFSVVRVWRDHHRRYADRPLAAVAAVGPGCHVGGDSVGLQRHAAIVRRQRAIDQQRHAAGRRLDRDATGCEWTRLEFSTVDHVCVTSSIRSLYLNATPEPLYNSTRLFRPD
jgi:hypothetical protein